MADAHPVAYDIAVFIITLIVLEFGADKFIDHTAIVARRTGISETLVGLLTAGGEWEELAVVIASIAQGRSSLAIGNIVGSAISNILGAFSLGLLFHGNGGTLQFDRSSRIYSILLLVATTAFVPIAYFPSPTIWLVSGSVLLTIFVAYIASVGIAISRGMLIAPEDSDDDSSDDSSDYDTIERVETVSNRVEPDESTPILAAQSEPDEDAHVGSNSPILQSRSRRSSLSHHIFHLLVGFCMICLAGYVLSHAAIMITDNFGVSDVFFGVIILAIATTLPEKFIAILSGHRGHTGILVANTAGSNIFLLLLCAGIVFVDTSGTVDRGNVSLTELLVMWASTFAFTLTIWFGARYTWWIGATMLLSYIVFIVLDFIIIHDAGKGQ